MAASMEKVTWQDVRLRIKACNPVLFAVLDEINPGSKYPLFLAHYPFGSEVLKKGILQLPNPNGEIVAISDPSISKQTRDLLSYNQNSNPVSLILKGSAEIFVKLYSQTIPFFGLVSAGRLFGTWYILSSVHTLHPNFIWEMTAGARSLFMLPKISRTVSHQRLQRELGISADVPHDLMEHWQVFKEIDGKIEEKKPWELEILYFTKPWFQALHELKWHGFWNYMLEMAWKSTEMSRNQFVWDMVFSAIQEEKNINPDPFTIGIIKQLFGISVGALSGLAPAIDDQAGPISKIQMVYEDFYKLEYAPIIMQPYLFNMEEADPRPVYYSLEFLTIIEVAQKSRTFSSKLVDLKHIQHLLIKFQDVTLLKKLNLENTPYQNFSQFLQFDFYHSDIGKYKGLKVSSELPEEDGAFLRNATVKKFPENSPFLRGCIRIKKK